MLKDKDLLKTWLEFSGASRQEASTAEENIMRLLMQEIEDLLEDITLNEPRRIWTLHKVVGNQIHFYKSNNFQRSANHRDLVRSITNGLIGEAIRNDEDVLIFKNADKEENYVKGWDDCQSELISLVRGSRNNVIGVINIESNIPNDFGCNDSIPNLEVIIQQLKQIISIASNHISLIFRNQSLVEGEKSSTNLIKSISEAPVVTRAVLQEIIGNLAHWLNDRTKLLRIILYLTEPGDKNKYKRLSKIDLAADISSSGVLTDGIVSEISQKERMRLLFEPGPRRFSRSIIADIFNDDFTNSLLAGSEDPGIYFLASEVLDDNQKTSARYFVGVILAEPIISNFETVQTFFEIVRNVTRKHLRYKLDRYNSLLNRATIEIYKTVFQEDSLRVALNKIATQIADETESRFCIIYLVAAEEAYHSRHKFYLGGAGKGTVDFADIRFDQDKSIVSYVLTNQERFYSEDFYNCEQNRHLLDRHLKEQGLEQPEVYAFPLSMQDFGASLKIGAILLFRENSDAIAGTNRPNSDQVKLRLSDWTEYLSSIIYKKQRQADAILAETFKKLAETLPNVIRQDDTHKIILQLQIQVKKEILPLWREIMNPAIFVIYKVIGEKIEIVDPNILPKVNFEPPKFKRGQGLTGSVIISGEVYEPFIEDFEPFTEDFDYSKGEVDSIPTPDRVCKLFWDGVLGDKRRMYYGRHVILEDNDYILLIVGVRQNRFLPSLGYKLVHDFTETVVKCLKGLVERRAD